MKYSHNVSDFRDIADDLGRSRIARQIALDLRENAEPGVLGVYGSWGSGKSHLLSQIIWHLFDQNKGASTKLIVCAFDAWKYELEGDLAIGLVKSLRNIEKQAIGENPPLTGADYKKIATFLLQAISDVAEYAGAAGKLASMVTKIAARAVDLSAEADGDQQGDETDAHVDVIHARMRELVASIVECARRRDAACTYRLVIFIDDLDRCSPENMVRMFEWLKVHLLVGECSYVIALDNIAAARAIVGRYREYLGPERDLAYGLRYLEKLFDSEYELDVSPDVERMALRKVYGGECAHRRVSSLATSEEGVGSDFPGVGGIDELLQLHTVCTPRTMMKIVAKYRRTMSLLHSEDAEQLRRILPASSPFWLLYLIALYYRLAPSDLDDFVRGRGVLFELMRNPRSASSEKWGDGPMYEFCAFSCAFASRSRESMHVPDSRALFALAQLVRENALVSAGPS